MERCILRGVGDLAVFTQRNGLERVWVPKAEESAWIARFEQYGWPAARWADYIAWGRRFHPVPDPLDFVTLHPKGRRLRPRKAKRSYRDGL